MTVKELRRQLNCYPEGARVVIRSGRRTRLDDVVRTEYDEPLTDWGVDHQAILYAGKELGGTQ